MAVASKRAAKGAKPAPPVHFAGYVVTAGRAACGVRWCLLWPDTKARTSRNGCQLIAHAWPHATASFVMARVTCRKCLLATRKTRYGGPRG